MTNIYIAIIGLFGGLLSGFFGIGGAIVMIPCLVIFLGFSQKIAQGTLLTAMIPPIGLFAAMAYWKAGHVDLKAAIIIAITVLLGGWIGSLLIQNIPDNLLRKAFAVLLILTACRMWFEK
jgi:uncharacterized protein